MPDLATPFDLDTLLDGVAETSTDSGTDALDLDGALGSRDTLATHLNLDSGETGQLKYVIIRLDPNKNVTHYEIGLGEVTAGSPDSLARDFVLDSSDDGGLVHFRSGEKLVGVLRETGPQTGKVLESYADVFGVLIADGRTSELDLGGHYRYSPERWRLRVNGARQFPEYNTVSGFTDVADHWDLSPSQGDTMVLESTTRPRYTVQYELVRTLACKLDRQLQSGDNVKVGHFDGDDGWFLEKKDSHGSLEAEFVSIRNGADVFREPITLKAALTAQQTRLGFAGPWYDVGRTLLAQSFPDDGFQQNPIIGRGSSTSRGPRTANLPIRFEITRGGSADPITLECGSAGIVTQGSADVRSRSKPFTTEYTIGSSGVWEPAFGMRINPNDSNVNAQLVLTQIIKYSANSDVELSVRVFAPEHVHESDDTQLEDADFSTVENIVSQNTALQFTSAVDSVIQADGTTFSGAIDPSTNKMGGYQIGYDKLISSNSKGVDDLSSARILNTIPPGDIVVVMAFAKSAAGTVEFGLVPEEDW